MNEQGDIPIIGEYIAVATHDASGSQATSQTLTVKANTISLYFKRYTLARKNRLKYFIWPQIENPLTYTPDASPEIEGYEYKAAPLREGYLYLCIFNGGSERIFKEFKVNIDSSLTNIASDLSGDIRNPKERASADYYQVKEDDVVWMAYSEFQWSAAYINKIRKDEDVRSNRMQKFDAAEWTNNQTAPDAFNVEQIDSYFPLDEEDSAPEQMHDNRWTPGVFQDSMNYGYIAWWKTKHSNAKQLDEGEEKKLEVFCCLHDSLGCADDVGADLVDEHNKLEALIWSIQTGKSTTETLKAVKENRQDIGDNLNEEQKQINALFSTSLTVYHLIYGSTEGEKEYADTTD